jgi:UDP-N-acetylglucosamine 2-epimerase (non-hydrolysing)
MRNGVFRVKKIMLVFGTRPEAIKMCPLVQELKKQNIFDVTVTVTGQHREMLDEVLRVFGVSPDHDLSVMKEGQTLFDVTSAVLLGMERVLEKERPDLVLVHGDTTTAFAAALAAFYKRIPVGHVEAGLRTGDLYAPYPEEFNRLAVGNLAALHFSPTEEARENLIKEGKVPETVFITGNTAIDALKTTVREDYTHPILEKCANRRLILLTAHRRENLGAPMERIFSAVKTIAKTHDDVFFVYPVHPNPVIREAAHSALSGVPNVMLCEPLSAIDFHNVMARAALVLTDSGGAQEEAPFFGIPVLVMRETTERPEGIRAGTAALVGADEKKIIGMAEMLLSDEEAYARMSHAENPYGDGHAAERICEILKDSSFFVDLWKKRQ